MDDKAQDRGTCSLCGGSGMVSVPSLKALARGQWGTQAVYCRCPLGPWIRDRQKGDMPNGEPRPLLFSLDEYEQHCPDWRRMLIQHDDECAIELERRYGRGAHAKELDRVLNAIIERMRSNK